jgi:UDP-2-acetamido-3-amino-2,3-dideoxy-glucuronate N-acetyltransferase
MKRDLNMHERSIVETDNVGPGTVVGAFTVIQAGASVGSDCHIGELVFIARGASLGDGCVVTSGVQITGNVEMGVGVHIGANASFSANGTGKTPSEERIIIHDYARIGAGSVLLPGITVGASAVVFPGAVVTRSVPPHAKVAGNPARITGYVITESSDQRPVPHPERQISQPEQDLPGGCTVVESITAVDMRGSLAAMELEDLLPFEVNRFFCVFDVPSHDIRGEHAHKECWQALTALNGDLKVMVDDGSSRSTVELTVPGTTLVIPPGVWASQYAFSREAVLGVFASHRYESSDYIRDYGEFLAWKERTD